MAFGSRNWNIGNGFDDDWRGYEDVSRRKFEEHGDDDAISYD